MLDTSTLLSPVTINAIQSLEPDCGLKLGNSGRDVQRLQLILKGLDFYKGALDGYFGFRTERSLLELQSNLGVANTGEFDLSTWYQLTYWLEDSLQPLNGLHDTAISA